MNITSYLKLFIFVCLLSLGTIASASETNGTITNGFSSARVCHDSTCAAGGVPMETPGTINWKPTVSDSNDIVHITDAGLTGRIWGNELGWIDLEYTGGGVNINPTTGVLSGQAWSQVSGWINFAPTGESVTINSSGEFSGFAWTGGVYGGWIQFDCTIVGACVKTDWRPIPARGTPPVVIATPSHGGAVLLSNITGSSSISEIVNDVSTCEPYLTSFISPSGVNDPHEVRKLKTFLKEYENVQGLPDDGVYDALTKQAVVRFQEKYSTDVLSFWKMKKGSGNVYITTKWKINAIVCARQKTKLTCPYFDYAKSGQTGASMKRIQMFLKTHVDSSLIISGTYDAKTVEAMKRFQTSFKQTILVPWGITEATGRLYQSTRKEMHRQIGCFEGPVRLDNGRVLE